MNHDALDDLLVEAGGPPSSKEGCVDTSAVDDLAWRRYEASKADAATRERVEAHLVVCAYCRDRLHVRPAHSRWWWAAIPIAAGLVTAALLVDLDPAAPDFVLTDVRGSIAELRADVAPDTLAFDANSRIVLTLGSDTARGTPPHVVVASTDARGRLRAPLSPSVEPQEDGTLEIEVAARALFGGEARSTHIVVGVANAPLTGIEGDTLDALKREHGHAVWLTRPCRYEGDPP